MRHADDKRNSNNRVLFKDDLDHDEVDAAISVKDVEDVVSSLQFFDTKPKKVITNIYKENHCTKKIGGEVMEFEIVKEAQGESKSEFENLHDEINAKVELEFENSLKNPYCLLPVDLKSIKANSTVRRIMKSSKPNTSYHATDTSKTGTIRLQSKKHSRRTRDISRTNNHS